jgi:putative transposase
MKKSKFSESEIFKILKSHENGMKVSDLSRQHGISSATFYGWRSKYGGMDLPMLRRVKELEEENRRLKKMYAEVSMDKMVLQEIIEKKL